MRAVLQRVSQAKVRINQKIVGRIGQGLLVFLGVGPLDKARGEEVKLAKKILNLRIFENEDNKFDKSVLEIKGEILVIPQFTLFADCSGGNRPFFGTAARPEVAEPLFEKFVAEFKKSGLRVEKGNFGAKMEIEAVNDGPVTIILDSNGQNQ